MPCRDVETGSGYVSQGNLANYGLLALDDC